MQKNEQTRISVIIPVLNDAAPLARLLAQLCKVSVPLEIVISDGGSHDTSAWVAEQFGVKFIRSPRGRGIQINRGAAESTGDVLWFLHADNMVGPAAPRALLEAMEVPGVVGGAFTFDLREPYWYRSLLNRAVRLRSCLMKLPFGDQGIFVRRSAFKMMEGFRPIPFLEDLDFVQRLRALGILALLQDPIGISGRRWEEEGFFRTTLRNWTVEIAYFLGVPPVRLAAWYQRTGTAPDEGAKEREAASLEEAIP